jgi:hypothetical protein
MFIRKMIWNDVEFFTYILAIELEKNVEFKNSPIVLWGCYTSFDSPAFQNPNVREFLETFSTVKDKIMIQIDSVCGPISDLPGIFITPSVLPPGEHVTHDQALNAINAHLKTPYIPVDKNFKTLGFFPSREGCPIQEITDDGVVYNNGIKYGKEILNGDKNPQWVTKLVEKSKTNCYPKLSHYKISENGTKKNVYITTTKLF